MSGTSQDYDGGKARFRPKRRQVGVASEATVMHVLPTVRFTPPCLGCHYPMLAGETACLGVDIHDSPGARL